MWRSIAKLSVAGVLMVAGELVAQSGADAITAGIAEASP